MNISYLMLTICVVIALPGLGAAAVGVYSLVFRAPKVLRKVSGDVVLLVAHQDDCVIEAGEYSLEVLKGGGKVQIMYLTCGSGVPGDARAITRRREAEQVWSAVGVGGEDLTCLGLPASEVAGPSRLTEVHLRVAREQIEQAI